MHVSLWRTGVVTITIFCVLTSHVPSAFAFSFWPPQLAAASAAVTEGSTSFFSTLWCTTKSFFGASCAPLQITESTTVTEEESKDVPPTAVVPQIIYQKPTYVTNEYYSSASPTVIREIVREGTSGTISQIDWNTFVKNTFFAKQIERTDDNVNDRISASLTDLEESFSTSLFSTTGNATIGGTLSVAGLTTFALGLSAQSSSTITDLTIVNATTTNLKFTALADGCLSTVSGLVTSSGAPCGAGGGGGSGGTWATTTSLAAGTLINYSINASDVVAIGSNSTTSAEYWFDPNAGIAYLSGNVGIGTAAPSERLTVVGTTSVSSLDITDGSIFVGGERFVTMQAGSANNYFVGVNAGTAVASNVTDSNFLGSSAGQNAANAWYSNFLGNSAGLNATNATHSNFLGNSAGNGADAASNSNFLGHEAGKDAGSARYSNFLGFNAGSGATEARYANFFGGGAGFGAVSAFYSNFSGQSAGSGAVNASYSNFFGDAAGAGATNAANSIFLGLNAGLSDMVDNTVGDKSSILIGNYTSTGGFSNSIAIGQGAANSAVDQVNIGRVLYMTGIGSSTVSSSSVVAGGKVGIGTDAPTSALTVIGTTTVSSLDITDGSIFVGGERFVTMQGEIGGSVNNNFLVGVNAGSGITDVAYSNFLGNNAGSGATDATDSNFLGHFAGQNATNAYYSNFFGTSAGSGASGASRSNFLGANAGSGATDAASSNFLGANAGEGAINAESSNFLGAYAGNLATEAAYSNFLGHSAGLDATNADHSNFIGYQAGQDSSNANNSNFVGNVAGANAVNASFSNFFGIAAGANAVNAANSIFVGRSAGQGDTVDNTVGDKSSILIGNYTSTGGFSNSIAIGQGTANSTEGQVNIGGVLYMTGIGSSTTPSPAVMEGGRVGIGTASPNARLSVVGGAFDLQAISTEAIIGDEMIVDVENREFSTGADGWIGTNWDTSGGVAAHTAGQNEFALPDTFLTSPLVAGRYYQIEFDVQTTATGTSGFFVYLGGTFGSETYGLDIGSVSVSTIIKTVSTGDPAFILDSETWEGTIDNVSIKEVTLSGVAQTIRNSDGTVGIEFRAGGTGSNNTFVGKDAGLYNTGGAYNSFFGGNAGRSNTTGYFNTAYGYGSLSSNTTGNYNIANGSYSLSSNTTGFNNTANGYDSLSSNTTGYSNTANGMSSLFNNTTGFHNTANGEGSLLDNTTGSGNTTNGAFSLYRNTTGGYNTANGVSSLMFNSTGSNNVAIGTDAGRGIYQTSVNNSTFLGYQSGYSVATTSGNLFLGYKAGYSQSVGDYNILLGYNNNQASTTGSNQLNIGNLIYGTGLGINGVAGTGNIGIGTATPSHLLTVQGDGYFLGNITAASSTITNASSSNLVISNNLTISSLSDGCLSIMSDLVISSGVPCGAGGGGSGGGTWATTTSLVAGQSINYPIASATDIVAIGSFSTTSAEFWFDPNVEIAYFSGKIGIGTNIPVAALSVVGDISSTGNINGTGITGTTLTDTTLSISGGVITDLVSISDGTASWSGSTLSGFSSVGASTFTDGSFSVTGGNFTGVASISDGVASWSGSTLSGFTSVSGTTLTDTTLIITGGAITSLTSIFDGVASWSGNSLSGFASVSGGTLTDGVFSVSSGNFTGVTSISGTNSNFTYATSSRLGLTGVGSAGVLVINSTGVVTSSTTIGVLTGGVNGYLARWTSGSTLSTSTFLSNGTVSGINATTSTSTFNIRGIAGSNAALTVASSTGASMFAVLANGNVGIGTSTPIRTLSVISNSAIVATFENSGTPEIQIRDSSSDDALSLRQSNGTGYVDSPNALFLYRGGSSRLGVYSAGTLIMGAGLSIGGSSTDIPATGLNVETGNVTVQVGNLGIGSTTPSRLLTVEGEGYLSSLTIRSTSTLGYASTTALTVSGNGYFNSKVGIGSSSPSSVLSISNSISTAANTPLFTIASTTGGTSTSTLFTVLANGNVGIGTSSPSTGLHVFQNGLASFPYSQVYIEPTGSAQGSAVTLKSTFASTNRSWYFGAGIGGVNDNRFRIVDLGVDGAGPIVERINIFENGNLILNPASSNVGIGTTTPFRLLTVAGDGYFLNNITAASSTVTNATSTNFFATNLVAGTSTVTGNATIGGTLGVTGTISGGGNNTQLVNFGGIGQFNGTDGTAVTPLFGFMNEASLGMYRPVAGALGFTSGGIERMRIDSVGNVGIGTTSPSAKLSIHAKNGETNSSLFSIGSSTASVTTRLFSVGNNGAFDVGTSSNQGFHLISNAATAGNGLSITTSAAGGGVALSAVSDSATESISISSKGSGTLSLNGAVYINGETGQNLSAVNIKSYSFGSYGGTLGSLPTYTFSGGVNSALTAATEVPDVKFNMGQTKTHSNGAITLQRSFLINAPTQAFTSASGLNNITQLATFGIDGAPNTLSSGFGTTTNAYAILVGSSSPSTRLNASTTNSYGLGIFADAGAVNNYAAIFMGGNVGIGTTSPSRTLSVTGTVAFDGLTSAAGIGSGSLCLDATNNQVVYNSGTDSCLPSLRATKHDITPLAVTGLDIINALESVSFAYNTGDGRTRFGFIAEDAAAIDAHLATYDAEGGISGIDDRSVLSVMVKAVQELYTRVLALVDTVTGHEERIVELEDEIATLKAQTAELLNAQNPQGSGNGGDQEPPVVETPPEEPTPDGEPSPVEETPVPEPEPIPEVAPEPEPVPTDPM